MDNPPTYEVGDLLFAAAPAEGEDFAPRNTYRVRAGGRVVDDAGVSHTLSDARLKTRLALSERWLPPAVVVDNRGQGWNLRALTAPFGLLPPEIQTAFRAAAREAGGCQRWNGTDWRVHSSGSLANVVAYRLCPARPEVRYRFTQVWAVGNNPLYFASAQPNLGQAVEFVCHYRELDGVFDPDSVRFVRVVR